VRVPHWILKEERDIDCAMKTQTGDLSPFAQAAMTLDSDFAELEQLSGQLDRLSLESDSGLDRAKKILSQFGECGERIGDRLQNLATTLNEARASAEQAANRIAERANQVQLRQQENDRMVERFNGLNGMVAKINAILLQLKKPEGAELSSEEKSFLNGKLPELDSQMGTLIEEAGKLKKDAQHANLKTVERNADSLGQTLNSARRKLSLFIDRAPSELSVASLH
jgi:chromosome segregation ATPase